MTPTIRTERLLLRPFVESDADAVLDLLGREEIVRWGGPPEPFTRREQAVEWIATRPARAGEMPGAGIFAIVPDGFDHAMGLAILAPLKPSAGNTRHVHEIGWHVHPDVWRRGYAFEAATAMVRRAVEAGLDEVWAVTKPGNEPSQGVCRKLGMTHLGLTDDWYDQTCETYRLTLAPGT